MSGVDLNPSSVRAVARKDFRDAVRSRGLLVLTLVFVVFFVASAYFFTDIVGNQVAQQAAQQGQDTPEITSDAFTSALTNVTTLMIPLVALVVAYASVVGERESGSLKLLLSLPHSRLDVVVGKTLGRSGVVAVPVLIGFLAAMLLFPLSPVSLSVGSYLGFALLTMFLGVVFVSLAVGVSAAASTSRRAVGAVFVAYALFNFLWNNVVSTLASRLAEEGMIEEAARFKLQLFLKLLNPTQAYKTLTTRMTVDSALNARLSVVGNPFLRGAYADALGESVPWYLSDAAVAVLLLAWLTVPLAIGYLAFEAADL